MTIDRDGRTKEGQMERERSGKRIDICPEVLENSKERQKNRKICPKSRFLHGVERREFFMDARSTGNLIAQHFDRIGWKYKMLDENDGLIRTGVSGLSKIGVCEIFVDVDDDGESLHVISIGYVKFNKDNQTELLKALLACNEANKKYRWVKFVADRDRGIIRLEDDAVVEPGTVGAEAHELVGRMAGIADKAYDIFTGFGLSK